MKIYALRSTISISKTIITDSLEVETKTGVIIRMISYNKFNYSRIATFGAHFEGFVTRAVHFIWHRRYVTFRGRFAACAGAC